MLLHFAGVVFMAPAHLTHPATSPGQFVVQRMLSAAFKNSASEWIPDFFAPMPV